MGAMATALRGHVSLADRETMPTQSRGHGTRRGTYQTLTAILEMPGGVGGLSLGSMFLELCVGLRDSQTNRLRPSDRNRLGRSQAVR
jgi:hypothetical protein